MITIKGACRIGIGCAFILLSALTVSCRPPEFDIPVFSPAVQPKIPEEVQALRLKLNDILPPEARGSVQLIPLYARSDEYMILCKFTLNTKDTDEKSAMEKIACQFIFATYESVCQEKLPVVSSTIVIRRPNGNPGLTIGIGQKTAAAILPSGWKKFHDDPAAFLAWLKKNTKRAPDAYQKCSYGGVYAR